MKKNVKFVTVLSVMVLFTANIFAATVDSFKQRKVDPVNEPLTVNYLGQEDGYLIFSVSVQPNFDKTVQFALNDKAEGELYSTIYKGSRNLTFKIEKRDNEQLDFRVVVNKKVYSKSFADLNNQTIVAVK